MAEKLGVAGHIVPTVGKQRDGCCGLPSFLLFTQSRTSACLLMPPIFRVGLHTSTNSVYKLPHRCAQRFVSKVIPVKLSSNINCHSYLREGFSVSTKWGNFEVRSENLTKKLSVGTRKGNQIKTTRISLIVNIFKNCLILKEDRGKI